MKTTKPGRIRLFIKPTCPWCHEAIDWLNAHKIAYDRIDVIADPRALIEMTRLSGQTLAPVIEVDGKVLADFGAKELAEFWNTLGHPLPPK